MKACVRSVNLTGSLRLPGSLISNYLSIETELLS